MHLDRGSPYTSFTHQTFLAKYWLLNSVSLRVTAFTAPQRNAFFLNLKMERDWQSDYANHADATSDKAEYVVSLNIEVRLHSKLGN